MRQKQLGRRSRRGGRLIKRNFERLESREMLDGDGFDLAGDLARAHRVQVLDLVGEINWTTSSVNPSFFAAGPELIFTPTIAGGSQTGVPADSPANAVDPNTPAGGAFGGVASIQVFIPGFPGPNTTQEFRCTGTVVAPTFVLTAGHCFDALDQDGQLDPGTTAIVNLNDGDPSGNGLFSSSHVVSSITINDSFAGFASNLNDDIAILELATPVPVGTPIYSLPDSVMDSGQRVNLVGYGLSGSGDTGFITDTNDPNFASLEVKRQRQNRAELFDGDDEGIGPDEIYLIDFDGPTGNGFLGGGTLGNDVEGMFGPGDSGGPAFAMDNDGNLLTDNNGRLIVAGINTFNGAFGGLGGAPGEFGSLSGGNMIGPYTDWIHSIIGVDIQLSTNVTITDLAPSVMRVTYQLSVTNAGANDATGLTIDQTDFVIPPNGFPTLSVSAGTFAASVWDIGALPATATETLTYEIILFNTPSPEDPFDIAFAVATVNEPDTDDTNNSVADSLDTPTAASISGSSWVVDAFPLEFTENGTLSWENLDTLSVTYAISFATAPPLEIFGPTDGSQIPATLSSWDGHTAEYTFDNLTPGFYKVVTVGNEMDFSVLPGDADGSKVVDVFDFGLFATLFNTGPFGSTPDSADFNGSGDVNVFDFGAFATHFGSDLSAFTPPTTPLPPPSQSFGSAAATDAVWASLSVAADDSDEDEKEPGRRHRRRGLSRFA